MPDRAEARLRRPFTHALSTVALAGAVAGTGTLADPADADASRRLDRTERQVIHLINAHRRVAGLPRVRASLALARSSAAHSTDMLRRDFFAHASSNGTPFSARVRRYKRAAWVGENLGYVQGDTRSSQARAIVSMWLKSPSHRAVVFSRGSRRVGVGRRSGRLNALPVTIFTADFASAR